MGIRTRTSGITFEIMPPGPSLDPSTIAWVNAVIANGGSVSAARQTIVDNLVVGLKADGIWTKLDRLWLFAVENTASALTDLIATALATNTAATFTADDGYTGNGLTAFINSGYNPTLTVQNYVLDSACLFGWKFDAGSDGGPLVASNQAGGANNWVRIFPVFTDTNVYFDVNANPSTALGGQSADTGLWLINRTNNTNEQIDRNGSQLTDAVVASNTLPNDNFTAMKEESTGLFYSKTISCMGFGGGLSGADRTNIYNRIRTYMTAVGVP